MKLRRTTLFLIIVFLFSLIFKPDKALDLFRYYQTAESWGSLDYMQVVMLSIEEHGDFLYFLILKVFVDLGIPIQFVTAIFATLFYKGALLILHDNYNNDKYSIAGRSLAETAVFFTVPIHLILSIARMTCSFSFVFMAIHLYNKRNYFWALVLTALAICAHTGTSIYVGLFLAIEIVLFVIRKFFKASSKIVAIYMIFGGLLIVYVFSLLSDFLAQIPFFATHSYYLKYVDEIHSASYRENGFITFFAMITYIALNAFYAFKSNLKGNDLYCTCISCTVPIFYFLGNLFSMRACMFSIPFYAVCLMGSYSSSNNKIIYKVLTIFTTMVFILVLLAFNRLYL